MTEFTASNGARIEELSNGTLVLTGGILDPRIELSPGMASGMREFFQHEGDADRGRWRWPENPDWVAIEGEERYYGRTVVLVNERTLERFWLNDLVLKTAPGASIDKKAARAFFEAHPEPEPEPRDWADAQFIAWRDGAYLPQIAQRDVGARNLGWRFGVEDDYAWLSEDRLADVIGDAVVSILIPGDS